MTWAKSVSKLVGSSQPQKIRIIYPRIGMIALLLNDDIFIGLKILDE